MDVVVPKVGLTVEVVEVLEWHAKPGDTVTAGDPLVDIAADKADIEIEAPADGVLEAIIAEAGSEVRPGETIARIGDGSGSSVDDGTGGAAAAVPATESPEAETGVGTAGAAATSSDGGEVVATPVARRAADALGVDLSEVDGSGVGGRVRRRDVESIAAPSDGPFPGGAQPSSPAARRLAGELGIALETAVGTGLGGRIVEADVRRAKQEARQPAGDPPAATTQALPSSGLDPSELEPARWTAARRLTARRMAESVASVAPVTLHRRADAAPAMAAARALKEAGVRATFTHVLMACTAAALAEHPQANSVWEGEKLMRSKSVHLGLAVDVPDGLFVPVVRHADKLAVGELATISAGLVAQCRAGSIAPESMRGSTFSVSNLGMLGVEQFTPVVNPPHVAILGVGAIAEETVPGGSGIAFRKSCHLSLTFDHRAIDGAPAARFLDAIVERLQSFEL